MEALGNPSISRASMGGGHVFRKLVYAGNRHNDIHYRSPVEIYFTASGFFLKTFDSFLCESTHYEKQEKKKKKKKKKQTKKKTKKTTT